MPNENSPSDVLRMQTSDDVSLLRRQVEELQAQLAQYEPSNVVETEFGGETPRYRLREAGFYGSGVECSYFAAGREIEYTETPNLEMVPINDAAKRRMQMYIEYLTECQQRKAQQDGRQFNGLVTDRGVWIADADQVARQRGAVQAVVMPTDKGEPPPMPHMAPKRGPGRPRKTVNDVTPPAPPSPRPGFIPQTGEEIGFRNKGIG